MTHIQQRRDQSAIWYSENPILFEGEAGHETDTGRWKLGDGVTPYDELPYKSGVDSVAGKNGTVELVVADVDGAAPTESPNFTGSPTAPTPLVSDNDETIATTKFVRDVLDTAPALGGNSTAETRPAGDDSTSIATTAFVKTAVDEAVGAGVWQTWTPVVTSSGGAFTTVAGAGRFTRIGDTIVWEVKITITNAGTATGGVFFTLPQPPRNFTGLGPHIGAGRENALTGRMINVKLDEPTRARINSYDFASSVIASGYVLIANGTYEGVPA